MPTSSLSVSLPMDLLLLFNPGILQTHSYQVIGSKRLHRLPSAPQTVRTPQQSTQVLCAEALTPSRLNPLPSSPPAQSIRQPSPCPVLQPHSPCLCYSLHPSPGGEGTSPPIRSQPGSPSSHQLQGAPRTLAWPDRLSLGPCSNLCECLSTFHCSYPRKRRLMGAGTTTRLSLHPQLPALCWELRSP